MRNSHCWRCANKKNRVRRKLDQSHNHVSTDLLTVWNETAPHHKRRKEEASQSSPSSSSSSFELLDSLPKAVAIDCLARVSRLDHAALSLVSTSVRSLVVSVELYKARSAMGYAEKFVYICLSMPPDPNPRWFILRPTLDSATGKTVNRAHAIPSPPSQPPEGSAVVALDCGIYVVGGLVDGKPTSGVLLLDCRYHTWRRVSPMRVARASPGARVVDGKIYVLGGCEDDKTCSEWGEVFDPKTQTWAALPITLEESTDTDTRPRMDLIRDSVVIDDKVYVADAGNKSFFYSPRECKWGRGKKDWSEKEQIKRDWCVTDKGLLLSCGNDGCIYWCEPGDLDRCDTVGLDWREVEGWEMQCLEEQLHDSRVVHYKTGENLEDLLPGARLTSFGRNVLVFWDKLVGPRGREKSSEIWCAEIALERCVRDDGGWDEFGSVVWSSAILTPTADPLLCRSKLLYAISLDV
ncbi:unnamed protein product [Microthlaspi erraticum]|uniref:Uncharacterized protein n=1 Tax=Microthlaspi erraticum TaxID=1685480 RepID=A0A6D2HII3_9BRAS|nr:unnamed protein product [Microthlaspi erraticum]